MTPYLLPGPGVLQTSLCRLPDTQQEFSFISGCRHSCSSSLSFWGSHVAACWSTGHTHPRYHSIRIRFGVRKISLQWVFIGWMNPLVWLRSSSWPFFLRFRVKWLTALALVGGRAGVNRSSSERSLAFLFFFFLMKVKGSGFCSLWCGGFVHLSTVDPLFGEFKTHRFKDRFDYLLLHHHDTPAPTTRSLSLPSHLFRRMRAPVIKVQPAAEGNGPPLMPCAGESSPIMLILIFNPVWWMLLWRRPAGGGMVH